MKMANTFHFGVIKKKRINTSTATKALVPKNRIIN